MSSRSPAVVGGWTLLTKQGEGASGVVFRATRSRSRAGGPGTAPVDEIAAIKIARTLDAWVGRESAMIARAQRRWGPTLLEAGRLTEGISFEGIALTKNASWMATSWIDGEPLAPSSLAGRSSWADRRRLAAIVAHGVGRGLDELHRGGVRHGDVKPANILIASASSSSSTSTSPAGVELDRADQRGATLIDLDLASDIALDAALVGGGTPRYLAPELRKGEAATPAADLYALGIVLAEILWPRLAAEKIDDATSFNDALARHREERDGDASAVIIAWIEALTATTPGARPSAAWLATRAARLLDLRTDPDEMLEDRRARVRRAYIAGRSSHMTTPDVVRIDPRIDGLARTWLEESIALVPSLDSPRKRTTESNAPAPASDRSEVSIVPLDALGIARWLVALVGPLAAEWPLPTTLMQLGDGALAARLVVLAERAPPEAWTLDDVVFGPRGAAAPSSSPSSPASARTAAEDTAIWLALTRALASPRPDAMALDRAEEEISSGKAPQGLARDLAQALLRQGDVGRAFAALGDRDDDDDDDDLDAMLLRAEIARRRGERLRAEHAARRVVAASSSASSSSSSSTHSDSDVCNAARALLGRLAWDVGDLSGAEAELGDTNASAAAAEVRALVAYARGDHERGLAVLDGAARTTDGGLGLARIEGTRGMLEHARGRARESLEAFGRAVELATRAGAVIEEATYLTGLAAAGVDAGATSSALFAATRGALLWERLGRPSLAARAHLSRAAVFALVGASHEADLAAEETKRLALASRDTRAFAFARWAIVETRAPGDERARAEALLAAEELEMSTDPEDRIRAAARLLVWAPESDASSDVVVGSIDQEEKEESPSPSQPTRSRQLSRTQRRSPLDLSATDERVHALSATTRWEWWGARALSLLSRRGGASSSSRSSLAVGNNPQRVLSEIIALLDVPAPLGSRGPALAAAARLARDIGDGEGTRRIEAARRAAALTLREGAPAEHRAAVATVSWLEGVADDDVRSALGAAQVGELESIVRALSSRDRLKPLLEQVVDTMVLWTGVERGLLLLRAPDGRLAPRAARNLARQDLAGEQLTLSTSLARRAMSERQAICATDAFTQVGDLHASVHALGLRSVLAVPLIARGDVLGVVYLDDRVRRGAFGPGELAWVRLVASQAALAIADARDQTLLRRAVRRAERANARLSADLGAREAELATVRAELVASAGSETRFRYEEIGGRSEPMRAMLKLVDRVTMSEVPVLLSGESGTGKELVARAIHANGPRSARAFVSENCGSVPETLLESTLFGHVRGAFTGASATRAGLFDVADGGTLLLDEIGEMPLSMQTKLLRVLQNGEVRPVGGERSRTVNVRIIGATHRDLDAMVAAGTFREDLFYRLNVVGIRVPALRERREDIPLLVSRFVEKYSVSLGRKVKVTRAAMDRLTTFPWPGNVRQLENEIRRALVLADDRIDAGELSEEVSRGGPSAARDAGLGLKARVDALETQLVRDALQKTNGNQTRAAEVLGVSRFGLQKMMRRLGIKGVAVSSRSS